VRGTGGLFYPVIATAGMVMAEAPSAPGAVLRGGDFVYAGGTSAGPLSVTGAVEPSSALNEVGFRCAR